MAVFGISGHSDVYDDLRSVGCCKRCCLRYMGERTPEAYQDVDEWVTKKGLEDISSDDPKSKQMKCNPCVVCMGLLQGINTEDTVKKIVTYVNAKGYDSKNFSCAVSIPIAFQLRAYSLWFYLVDKFPLLFPNVDEQQENVITTIKVWKWTLCPLIAKEIGKDFDSGATCDFSVAIGVHYPDDEEECSCLHNSIYFAGCYNKFSRSLSQTPWVIEGERRMESSVQEIICGSIEKACLADGSKFVSSGREDVDVRMLGRGRPFACEVLNPRKVKFSPEEIQILEAKINCCTEDVAIRHLQIIPKLTDGLPVDSLPGVGRERSLRKGWKPAYHWLPAVNLSAQNCERKIANEEDLHEVGAMSSDREDLHHLKAGEEAKRKRYSALCMSYDKVSLESLENLESIHEVVLCQKTPIRVLHRRPLAVRNRTVYSMKATPLDDIDGFENKSLFKLDIVVQAGTYIKEFVHGDFGRTKPNLGLLLGGVNIDILALDVEEIMLDWPPPTEIAVK
ncbi:Putative tRNA pseudouridine synthase Pus10 [Gryllus bimaculatus]|nr:Putative tRNA pseudouridine synthase Pus10 [Gryllus bimaculatus]